MVQLTFSAALLFAVSVLAAPATPDPAGVKNIGNGANQQFIGGECLSSKDCATTACCAFNNNGGGICSGLGAQFQAGKTGCGFGDGGASSAGLSSAATSAATATDASAATNVAVAPATGTSSTSGIDASAPGSQNVGTGNGQQFITGQCFSDADCASGCCAKPKGVCSAVAVAFDSGKEGCGFTTTTTGGTAADAPAPAPAPAASSAAPLAAAAVDAGTATTSIDTSAPGSQNVGTGNGQQFITGQCLSDADCASGCCAKPKGVCSAVAVAFDSGKQGCGFTATGTSSAVSPSAVSSPAPVATPATGATAVTVDTSAPGSQNVGKANGQQFITGQCLTDADCASGCCAKPKGVCSAVAVAFDSGKQGCGFVGTAAA